MKLFTLDIFSKINSLKSGWANLLPSSVNEGIRLEGTKVVLDFNKDLENDVVNLENPKEIGPTRKEKIPVFRGYLLERVPDLKYFMEIIKKWGALDQENLKTLIDFTYPTELREQNVEIIFITGSSDPLSANIAEALKELYYPNCKVVDVLKKYYGVDVKDIIDWKEYERADPRTKKMIDTYLRQFSKGGVMSAEARSKFDGYIKKSSGLQSGARKILKPGHEIDDYIITAIVDAEEEWRQKYRGAAGVNQSAMMKYHPSYLMVDDTIIEGSTLRGIFKALLSTLLSNKVENRLSQLAAKSIYGYCLFSYKA
jgi:hypothetical protein